MISVRRFTSADVALGMRLKTAAKWNQTERDWHRALELDPQGCFVGLDDGEPAATLTCCLFGNVGWIAMVLTDERHRGKGLATALLQEALAELERRGARSVRLDATDLGRPVYEKLGFRVDGGATRYFGRPTVDGLKLAERKNVGPMQAVHLPSAARLDAELFGNDRTQLLRQLFQERPEAALVCSRAYGSDEIDGYVFARTGSRAVQIGPCAAREASQGSILMTSAFAALQDSPCYWDIPDGNPAAREFAAECGLAVERTFFRMTQGEAAVEGQERIWANFGPEKG